MPVLDAKERAEGYAGFALFREGGREEGDEIETGLEEGGAEGDLGWVSRGAGKVS